MFETLFYNEEGLLILNLEEIRLDYALGRYHKNPYGKVFVSCPSGYYSLFQYLSRIAGMRHAEDALERFRAEKLIALNRDYYAKIRFDKEQTLEKLLRASYYYYYYDNPKPIKSFLENFQDKVYNNEYDAEIIEETVHKDIEDNPEIWKDVEDAAKMAVFRLKEGQDCDATDMIKRAIKSTIKEAGRTDMPAADLDDHVSKQVVANYYLESLELVSEINAEPVYGVAIGSRIIHARDVATTNNFIKNEQFQLNDYSDVLGETVKIDLAKIAYKAAIGKRQEAEYVYSRQIDEIVQYEEIPVDENVWE